MKLTLVSGNQGKIDEWKRLLPADYELEAVSLDLDEIQSIELESIICDKVRRAYDLIGTPVIVEDVAAGLIGLNGLPGPFIKYFEISLGNDALYQLSKKFGKSACVSIAIAYFDGHKMITVRSDKLGMATSPRGQNGFGFDHCFVPDGHSKTYAEMSPGEKDSLSHRADAIRQLLLQL